VVTFQIAPLGEPLLRQTTRRPLDFQAEKLDELALVPVDRSGGFPLPPADDGRTGRVLVIRGGAFGRHKASLHEKLWKAVQYVERGGDSGRLGPRPPWRCMAQNQSNGAAPRPRSPHGLVSVHGVALATWIEAFRPPRAQMIAPLTATSAIPREPKPSVDRERYSGCLRRRRQPVLADC